MHRRALHRSAIHARPHTLEKPAGPAFADQRVKVELNQN
jgi:hypothetical protein